MKELNLEKFSGNTEKTKSSLSNWALYLLKGRFITEGTYKKFLEGENSRIERMKEMRLPSLKVYGFFDSLEKAKEEIKPKEEDKFNFRCISKDTDKVEREVGKNFEECSDFVKKLPGGIEKWKVEIKESAPTIISGSIIEYPGKRMTIESWHGPHYISETSDKYHAIFDSNEFDLHFKWVAPEGATDLDEIKDYAMKALKYIYPDLKPRENESFYLDYGVKQNGEIYFMDYNSLILLNLK